MRYGRIILWSVVIILGFLFASCSSKEPGPVTVSVSDPPAGQNVTVNQRAVFAKHFGDRFRSKYGESEISISGEAGRILVIKWVKVSRPFVAQLMASQEIVRNLREMGFKRTIMTDGQGSTWDVDLKN